MRCAAVRKIRSQKANSRFDGARVSGGSFQPAGGGRLPTICNLIMGYLFLASIYLVQDVWRYSTIIDLLSNYIFPITNKKDGSAYVDASMRQPHSMFVKYVMLLDRKKQFDLYFMNTFMRLQHKTQAFPKRGDRS